MFEYNKEFYPTPGHLIEKMLFSLDLTLINSVLEPSAGKADLIEGLEQKVKIKNNSHSWKIKLDIDCIEKDNNLRHILSGKGYRVVHDDFLTYETMKEYDLIIMNPPFSDGCKHLLKALQMQERNGGAVICLLNAETLKNPCTNDRAFLDRKLRENNADIEYISDAFMTADRKTEVEIALIKVQLPQVKKESFILDGLKKAQEQREFSEADNTQITEQDLYKSIVNQYNLEVEAGIKLIKEYYAMSPFILSEFDKNGQCGAPILNLDLSSNRSQYNNGLSVNEYIRDVRRKYWGTLFKNERFIGRLTGNLRSEFYNKVGELKDYDFSLFNIYEIKIQMQKHVVKGVEDTILALFEELSNKHHWYDETSKNVHYYNGWKTNKAYIINNKVIIPLSGYDNTWNKFSFRYDVLTKLRDIEKCFNYLDGGLTEAIDLEESLKFAEEYGETRNIQLKYFTVSFFKKGTCHIVFNNDELLKKFNIFGSQKKGWLPPSYGKKNYSAMEPEERQVVDEFEGEEEYKQVIKNADYYIFKGERLNLLEEQTA